ncbi:MAG: hypothetical protein KF791_19630 [Verrucomicrobiae bacterium]|nr:hypothetical protein [Verrucomicrobiae bacterium]
MNSKTLSALLGLIALGLGIGWLLTSRRSSQEAADAAARVTRMSNELVEVSSKLSGEQKRSLLLQTNLALRTDELGSLSNRWYSLTETLLKTEAQAKAAAAAAQSEIERRDRQIVELEGERDGLTLRMNGLTEELESLNGRISDTERKLATSEGNRDQLQKELRRLLAEKAELERRFNDLAALRDQVRKLKEDVSVARRLELLRRGLYGTDKKGAQLLNEGFRRPVAEVAATNRPIQAELGTDGSVKIGGGPSSTPAPIPPGRPR